MVLQVTGAWRAKQLLTLSSHWFMIPRPLTLHWLMIMMILRLMTSHCLVIPRPHLTLFKWWSLDHWLHTASNPQTRPFSLVIPRLALTVFGDPQTRPHTVWWSPDHTSHFEWSPEHWLYTAWTIEFTLVDDPKTKFHTALMIPRPSLDHQYVCLWLLLQNI